jgi:glycosyltransferase involved in cell wall biosynthesis
MFVTIGIPFYNAEKFLKDSIRSVFAQTHKNWELILLDDGSTDNSLQIAKSINDPRVRVYSDGKNKKLAARLNQIVRLAKSDIIVRMDADDLISPNRLKLQLEVLEKYPDIDLVSTGLFSVTDELELVGVRSHSKVSINFQDLLLKKGCGIVHASVIGRKVWFERNRYNEKLKLAQDYDLWLRTAKNDDLSIHLLPAPLYYYREGGSITPKKMLLAYEYEREMYKKYTSNWYYLVIKSILKTLVVLILSKTNNFQFLISRRSNLEVSNKYSQIMLKELKLISNTKVNGLDE